MGRIINIIFGFLLGLCPWANVLSVFYKGVSEQKKQLITVSGIFLTLEVILSVIILYTETFDNTFRIYVLALLIVFISAWIYSTSVFYKNNNNVFEYAVSTLIAGILSFFLVIINIIAIAIYINKKRFLLIIPQLAIIGLVGIILTQMLPLQFMILVTVANFTTIDLWLFSQNKNWLNKLFRSKRMATPTTNSSTNTNGQGNSSNTHNNFFEKGWSTDDTLSMEVNLLTIEDMIYPITLLNEYEKQTRNLIERLRKTSKNCNNNDLSILAPQLKSYFEETELDAVRHIYLESLTLLLEQCSNKHPEFNVYIEKLKLNKQQRYQRSTTPSY